MKVLFLDGPLRDIVPRGYWLEVDIPQKVPPSRFVNICEEYRFVGTGKRTGMPHYRWFPIPGNA